jgi:hypothetical protein
LERARQDQPCPGFKTGIKTFNQDKVMIWPVPEANLFSFLGKHEHALHIGYHDVLAAPDRKCFYLKNSWGEIWIEKIMPALKGGPPDAGTELKFPARHFVFNRL